MARKPTATAFAILGLIAAREGSAYELARRMERSHRIFYPRAQSHLYSEIKHLVASGFATARHEHVGRRPRTVYRITRKGHAALAAWLATPARPPQLEAEGLLHVAYAEFGTKAQLIAQLAAIRDHADEVLAVGAKFAYQFARTETDRSRRMHTNRLVWQYLWSLHQTQADWARWAIEEVGHWPDTGPSAVALDRAQTFFREAAAEMLRRPARGDEVVAEHARTGAGEPKTGKHRARRR
jgi:DNA-binding PadR family transcriptional regulator